MLCLETRTIDASILGMECKWSLGKKFWYAGRRWKLWNTETIDAKYKRWRIKGRSYGQHNIDFWSTND